jgi:hypothetical protein
MNRDIPEELENMRASVGGTIFDRTLTSEASGQFI